MQRPRPLWSGSHYRIASTCNLITEAVAQQDAKAGRSFLHISCAKSKQVLKTRLHRRQHVPAKLRWLQTRQ